MLTRHKGYSFLSLRKISLIAEDFKVRLQAACSPQEGEAEGEKAANRHPYLEKRHRKARRRGKAGN